MQECWELEEGFGISFTDKLLSGTESVDLRDVREEIRRIGRGKMLERCVKESQVIREVGKEVGCMVEAAGWCDGPGDQACQATAEP